MKGFRGYIGSRAINGSIIPQRVQNLVVRNYAETRGLPFLLSATEYYMDGCYMMLQSLVTDMDSVDGLIFYSLHMLPEDAAECGAFLEKAVALGKPVHFAMEQFVVQKNADIAVIADLFLTSDLCSKGTVDLQGIC